MSGVFDLNQRFPDLAGASISAGEPNRISLMDHFRQYICMLLL